MTFGISVLYICLSFSRYIQVGIGKVSLLLNPPKGKIIIKMKQLSNRVHLIGSLGADPEITEFENGSLMARLSLVTNELICERNGCKTIRNQWHTLIVWGRLAEICSRYLYIGLEIAVEGHLVYRSITDSYGSSKILAEVTVNDLSMISRRRAG